MRHTGNPSNNNLILGENIIMSTILNLRIRGPSSSAEVTIDAELSLSALKRLIAEKLDLVNMEFELLWGFPIKKPDFDDDEPLNGRISNNEMIRIVLSKKSPLTSPKKAMKKEKLSGIVNTIISSHQEVKSTNKSKSQPNYSPRITTIFGPARAINNTRMDQPSMVGRKRQRMTKMNASSQDDISIHLLEAVSGGSGKKNQFLRAAFRRAVELQYDQSTAHARVYSALSNTYRIEKCANIRRLGSGESTMMTVTFHKGFGSRLGTCVVETVDLMNTEQLKAVISLILQEKDEESRETLRTLHMAGCSPRTFWSLVHFFGGDVEQGLKLLLPGEDWAWLQGRRRTLSEKAKLNLEQKQQLESYKKSTRISSSKLNNNNNSSSSSADEDGITNLSDEDKDSEADEDIKTMRKLIQQHVNLADIIPTNYHSVLLSYLHNTNTTSRTNIAKESPTSTKKKPLSTPTTNSDVFTEGDILKFIEVDLSTLRQHLETSTRASTSIRTTSSTNQLHEEFEELSDDRLSDWITAAQRQCVDVWMNWFCHSDEKEKTNSRATPPPHTTSSNDKEIPDKTSIVEKVKSALVSVGIKGLGQMGVWRHAPEALLQAGSGLSILGLEKVKRMAVICYKLRESFPWLSGEDLCFTAGPETEGGDEEEEEEEDEEQERRRLQSEGWVLLDSEELLLFAHPASSHYLGSQVTIEQEPDDSEEGNSDNEEQPIVKKKTADIPTTDTDQPIQHKECISSSREVDGIIKAYLPATVDEPMALWKVWLQDGLGRQDLEELEVIEARERFQRRHPLA